MKLLLICDIFRLEQVFKFGLFRLGKHIFQPKAKTKSMVFLAVALSFLGLTYLVDLPSLFPVWCSYVVLAPAQLINTDGDSVAAD